MSGEYPGCEENNIVSTTASAATSVKQPTVTENKNKAASELVVYPNPATGELIIKWSSEYMGNAKLIIADAPGKASKQFDLNKQLADQLDRISVTTLSSGLYFLQIKNGGWQIAQHTLCKEVKYIMLRKKAAFKKDGLFKFCAKVEEEPLVICLLTRLCVRATC